MSSGQLPKLHFLSSEFQILGTAFIFLGSLSLLSKVINAFEVLIYCLIFETLQELVLSFFKLAHYYNKFLSQAFVIQMICWKKVLCLIIVLTVMSQTLKLKYSLGTGLSLLVGVT